MWRFSGHLIALLDKGRSWKAFNARNSRVLPESTQAARNWSFVSCGVHFNSGPARLISVVSWRVIPRATAWAYCPVGFSFAECHVTKSKAFSQAVALFKDVCFRARLRTGLQRCLRTFLQMSLRVIACFSAQIDSLTAEWQDKVCKLPNGAFVPPEWITCCWHEFRFNWDLNWGSKLTAALWGNKSRFAQVLMKPWQLRAWIISI